MPRVSRLLRSVPTIPLLLGLAAAAGLAGSVGVVSAGCSSPTSSSTASSDTKPVLADLTNDVILPSYRALDTRTEALRVATHTLQTSPSDASLTAAQSAWRDARKAWRQTEAFRFGPVESKSIRAAIDFWPASTTKIDEAAGTAPITPTAFDLLGSNAKGFMALEYLLFDNVGGNAAVLTKLNANGGARLAYASVAADAMKAKTAELVAAWELSGEGYARELTDAPASIYPSAKAAIDQLVNSSLFAAELVTNTKIGKPFGKQSGGTPQPDQEETPLSDNSIADMLSTLDGVRSVYTGAYGGTDGTGISDLVRAKNASLDDRVIAGLADAEAKISAIPAPFRTAIVDHKDAVETAYQAVRAVKTTMTTEVAGALGTTLKFNDNDGD